MLGKGPNFRDVSLLGAGYQQKGSKWVAADGLQPNNGAEPTETQFIHLLWWIYPPIYPPSSRRFSPEFSQDLCSFSSPTRRPGEYHVTTQSCFMKGSCGHHRPTMSTPRWITGWLHLQQSGDAQLGAAKEQGGEARGTSALPAPYVRLAKSVTGTSNMLLEQRKGSCLPWSSERLGYIQPLFFPWKASVNREESEGSIRQRDITSTILPISGTAACREGFSGSLCLWCAIIFYEKKVKMSNLEHLGYFQRINAIMARR